MGKWLARLLFDWVFVLLCRLMQGLLKLVDFMESFFDIFAGTSKVMYKDSGDFLINIFFGHDAVTNAFWAMALIAIVMAFGFCIVGMARKAADVTDSVKQSVGQIFSNFIRCLIIILLLNTISVAAINITNVLLDRINFALENAAILNRDDEEKNFSDAEYAAMARVLATVANYSVNPSADSRYNVNSCFNAIRNDLLALHVNGFFDYDYGMDENGHHTWQSALALLATSSDLTADLKLDTYYSDVTYAVQTVSREISTYKDFAPVQAARMDTDSVIETDVLIFLIAGMEAAQNGMYNNGSYDDALRRGYVTGEKDYMNLTQVRRDFDIWEMDYLVAYISSVVFIVIMAICIFTFIVRMFNLMLLYLVAPLFASSMPIDDGSKWQSWTQAFVIQLFSGFGSVIAMRLYLIIIPLALSSDLVYFPGDGAGFAVLNRMAQLLMVLGGAWAVLQASAVITGILAGNPGMAAIQQEGRIGGMVTHGAMSAVRSTGRIAGGIIKSPITATKGIKGLKNRLEAHHDKKSQHMARKALRQQNKADKLFDQADKKQDKGKSQRSVRRTMGHAIKAQDKASKTENKLDKRQAKYGQAAYTPKKTYGGIGSDSMSGMSSSDSEGSASGISSSGGFTGTPRTLGGPAPTEPRYVSPARKAAAEKAAAEKAGASAAAGPSGVSKSSGGSAAVAPPPPRARAQSTGSETASGGTSSSGGASSSGGGFTGTPRTAGGGTPPSRLRPQSAGSGTASGGTSSSGGGFTGTPRTTGGGTPPPPPPSGRKPGSSAPPPRNKR